MNESGSTQGRLFDIAGGWKDCEVDVGGVRLQLKVPADPDRVLDAQLELMDSCGSDGAAEPPDPYWAALWSAATPTAQALLQASWPRGTSVLELGCGVGLVGLAALVRGWNVTYSDYTPQAIQIALENARRNGYPQAQARVIDWHDPPRAAYEVILASDVLYKRESHAALLHTIDQLLAPGGVCWIGDPGRFAARAFIQAASDRFGVQLRDRDGRTFGVPHVGEFQLLVLHRRDDGHCQ